MVKLRVLIVAAAFAAAMLGGTVMASADADNGVDTAFLCPIVGDGVINADDHNGDNGVQDIGPPAGTSLLPGNNQAGVHANANALNPEGPGNPNAGPGGNPDFSPIWPG